MDHFQRESHEELYEEIEHQVHPSEKVEKDEFNY
jgi:hypothetical protein